MKSKSKIWITGSSGMLGKKLSKILKKQGHQIIEGNKKIFDQTSQEKVIDYIKENQPDEIIITSALVGGIEYNSKNSADFLYVNSMIALNIINAASILDIKKLTFLGSSCMYPKDAIQPINENSLNTGIVEFTNESYGIAKILGVKYIEKINSQYGRNYLAIVPTATYGPGDNYNKSQSHVIPAMIKRFHDAKNKNISEVVFWGSGKALREFIYIDDMAEGILFITKNYKKNELINLGSGEEITIKDLAYKIAKVVDYKGNIKFDINKPEGVSRKILDSTKVKELGWKPKYTLDEGLKLTYENYIRD